MRKTLRIKGKDRGFALIATITLMVLLALLSVGLLTMASSQTRISQRGLFAAEARSQAKLALEVAIGRLQCELGPDQRISANSGILDTSPDSEAIDGVGSPYILGAWDSWGTWMNRKNSNGVSLPDTYSKGRKELFRSWLISSARDRDLSDMDAGAKNLGQFRSSGDEQKVQLLGVGSLGRMSGKDKMVYAGLVQVDDANTPIGAVKEKRPLYKKSIAWWVSGENQKAKINSPQFNSSLKNEIDLFRSTWNTPSADLSSISGLSAFQKSLPDKNSADYGRKVSSLITLDTIGLLTSGAGYDNVAQNYHSITLDSTSLLSDSKFGGLKKDINIMLSQESLPEELKSTSGSDIGLRPYSTQDAAPTVASRPISSWNQLYEWANIWDSKTSSGQDASAKFSWDGQTPYSLVAADAEAVNGMMNNRHTYIRHPILLKMYTFIGMKFAKSVTSNDREPLGFITTSFFEVPIFVLWNPYNVTLRMEGAEGNPWGTDFGSHRLIPIKFKDNAAGRGPGFEQFDPAWYTGVFRDEYFSPFFYSTNHGPRHLRGLHDYGSSFRKTASFNSEGVVTKGDIASMAPGEILMFSQPPTNFSWEAEGTNPETPISKMRNTDRDAYPDAIPLVEGWDNSPRQTFPYSFVFNWNMRYDVMQGGRFPGCEYKYGEETYAGPDYWISNLQFADTSEPKPIDPRPRFNTPSAALLAQNYTEEYTPKNQKLAPFMMGSGIMDQEKFSTQYAKKIEGGGVNLLEDDQNSQWLKANPTVLNLNWGVAGKNIMDDVFMNAKDWLPDNDSDEEGIKKVRRGKGLPDQSRWAEYLTYHGVSVKWGNKPMLSTPRSGNWDDREKENYQAKIWQHSSPMLWGGQIIEPSDLACSYSPYQFEYKQGKGLDTIDLENIISTDGSKSAVFGGPQGEQVNKIIGAELPLHPPYALSGFAGFRLSPGWYDDGSSTKGSIAKRFAYQSGVPAIGIGNSFADPMLPPSEIFSHNEIAGDPALGDFWDHGLMINDGLWDTWFTSSLSKRPQSLTTSGNAEELDSVIKKVFSSSAFEGNSENDEARAALPNNRLIPSLGGQSVADVVKEISDPLDGYKKAAKYLQIDGGFNVNSSDVNAWKAVIGGIKDRTLFYMNEAGLPKQLSANDSEAAFSRFGIASSDKSHVDDMGSTGVMNGYPDGGYMAWTDLRKLDSRALDKLASSLAAEVKRRGPFLNMAEFINRRLAADEMGVKGALQAAIDKSGANSVFDSMQSQYIEPKADYPHKNAGKGSYYTGAPGYLIQSDILSVLGNILTTRDDSFKIRAYGEIASKSGKDILARAWCEVTVKRSINYVDPSNSPETPAIELNMQTGELKDSQLSKINKAFGRQFVITSFRWLSSEEV